MERKKCGQAKMRLVERHLVGEPRSAPLNQLELRGGTPGANAISTMSNGLKLHLFSYAPPVASVVCAAHCAGL